MATAMSVERRQEDRLMLAPNTDRSLALQAMCNGVDPNYVDGPWVERAAYEEWGAACKKADDIRHAAELAAAADKLEKALKSGGANGATWHPSPAQCEVSPKGFIRVKWCDRVRLGFYVKPETLLYLLDNAQSIRKFVVANQGVWQPRQLAYKTAKKPAAAPAA